MPRPPQPNTGSTPTTPPSAAQASDAAAVDRLRVVAEQGGGATQVADVPAVTGGQDSDSHRQPRRPVSPLDRGEWSPGTTASDRSYFNSATIGKATAKALYTVFGVP